jgi:UDP-glucose 4-epimerase
VTTLDRLRELAAEIAGERAFITGGAGFIGSRLAELLLPNNHVVVYDDFSRDPLALQDHADDPNLTVVRASVLDSEALRRHMAGSTYVVHCAGITGIDSVLRSPIATMRVNVLGSANALECAAEQADCKRVICFSTSEVFGQLAFRPEETSPAVLGAVGEGRWTYAVSKLAEEHLAYAYFRELGLPTVSVRPFNIYGPGQVGEGALRTFILRALANEDLIVHGDGTQIRAWCYIDDMLEGILKTMIVPAAVGESFNIGNPRTITTIYGLANTVIRTLGSGSKIRFVPRASADIELRIPHVEKARFLLGFEARVDLEEGIERTATFLAGQPV